MVLPTISRLTGLLFSFEGRIGRGEYWLGSFVLCCLFVLALVPVFLLIPFDQVKVEGVDGQPTPNLLHPAMLPFWIGFLPVLVIGCWMSAAVHTKRLHDLGMSGWWFLVLFIPVIGPRWGLYGVGFTRGDANPNAYGPPAASRSTSRSGHCDEGALPYEARLNAAR